MSKVYHSLMNEHYKLIAAADDMETLAKQYQDTSVTYHEYMERSEELYRQAEQYRDAAQKCE